MYHCTTSRVPLLAFALALAACGASDDDTAPSTADAGFSDSASADAVLTDADSSDSSPSNDADNPEQDADLDDALSSDAAPDASLPDAAKDSSADAAKDSALADSAKDAPVDAPPDSMSASAAIDAIKNLAVASSCYKYQWKDRGQAPKGYIKGMALMFGRAVCNQSRSDIKVVSQAKTTDTDHDALAWYSAVFSSAKMSNDKAGVDTLRHAHTLLIGLGMRESSGEYCCGRDGSASNYTSETCEAGAWQTSYNSRVFSSELPKLFTYYKSNDGSCNLDVFKEGVSCSAANLKNWGTGDGYDFQKLSKDCPGFAAEYTAVMLRVSGGEKGHYGPLRRKEAEVRPECDAMLQQVQTLVDKNHLACAAL